MAKKVELAEHIMCSYIKQTVFLKMGFPVNQKLMYR